MSVNKKVKAIILAAGQGKRLRPHTDKTPKCLVRVQGVPILHRQLAALEKNGLKEIILVTGFMADAVERYASSNFPNLQFTFIRNPRFTETNTLYSLALAAETLSAAQPVLQMNGDVVFGEQIIKMLLSAETAKSYIAFKNHLCGEEEIKIVLAANNTVAALNKKIDPALCLGEAVGINKFSPEFWPVLAKNLRRLKNERGQEYFEYAIEQTVTEGHCIYPMDVGILKVVEVDFPEDLETANKIFKV